MFVVFTCVYFNAWCRGRPVSVSELQTQWWNKRWKDEIKTTVDQGHLELGTYSSEWFNLKTCSLQTHTHYFSIISYNTHLHIMHLTQKRCSLYAPDTTLCSPLSKFTEGRCVCVGKMHKNEVWVFFVYLRMCKHVCMYLWEQLQKWHKHTCTIDTISHTDYISHVFFHNKTIQDLQTNEIRCQKTLKTLRWHKTPVQEHRSDLQ